MRKTMLILFLATSAQANIGVVISSTGTVIAKEVYGGDLSPISGQLALRTFKDPSLTFATYDLTDSAQAATFNSTAVPSQVQMSIYQVELATTSASLIGKTTSYVAANAVSQIQINAKMARILELRQLLGLQ